MNFHHPSVLALAAVLSLGLSARAPAGSYHFHHEDILGTSLDLQVAATDEKLAAGAETAVLGEIERLRKILSSYDPASEISRLNTATEPMVCPPEVLEVLSAYDQWQAKSQGAYSGHIGELAALWSRSEKAGTLPTPAALKPVLASLAAPGWKIDPATRSVTRLSSPRSLDVNSLAKGYIATKSAIAARKAVPGVTGLLVNIGGDIFASGRPTAGTAWEIGVADPKHSEDNAPPLTKVHLADQAVSTSAAYERGYDIGGKHYSHILDARTGQPAEGVSSATVTAANNAVSNALATTLCVLKPEEGLALVKSTPGAECLIVTADGRQLRSEKFAALESPTPPAGPAASASGGWPAGYQVAIAIDLKPPAGGRKPKRPFVAVWVEDAAGKRVRTVTVWGHERKYLPELKAWWREAKADQQWAATVTRATRNAGQHRIEWDGKDDQGQPLPPGTYTIVLETNREHGSYSLQKGTIVCGKIPEKGTIPAGTESGETQLTYGPAAP